MSREILLQIDPAAARRWQGTLAERLRRRGHRVTVAAIAATPPPRGLAMLEHLEETLYGRHRGLGGRLSGPEVKALVRDDPSGPVDLIIDLTGDTTGRGGNVDRLSVRAGHAQLDAGIADALLGRMAPVISVVWRRGDDAARLAAVGRPAVPQADVYIRALDHVAAGLVTIVLQAVDAVVGVTPADANDSVALSDGPATRSATARAGRFLVDGVAEKIALRLKRMTRQRDHWVVGWRQIAGDAVGDTLRWPAGDYRWLQDDGERYYADPFVFVHQGRPWLFVEEYPYRTGRGVLSVAAWTGAGWETPVTILERPHHLSWPMVFARDGQIWMMPETSASGQLELYRAVEFPHRWDLHRVSATGQSLADATMLETETGWWMLAATAELEGASSWDTLGLLRAQDPLADWTRIGDGAVLTDRRAARPAGVILRHGDHWVRPVQDCTLSYGGALAFARIDRLGETGYAQTLIARLPPRREWNAIGVHTLNAAGGIEVIDINRGFDSGRRDGG